MYEIILFYKYTAINDPKALMQEQKELARKLNLKGRMIIAEEGINGTFEGLKSDVKEYCDTLTQDPRFADVHFKRSVGTGKAFPKLSIKARSEIVSSYLPLHEADARVHTGKHLSPEILRDWIKEKKNFKIVDMRNDYEYASGHFRGSLFSGMKYFRDLPKATEALSPLKEETLVTVCTGGVRCEKASSYLLNKGFKDVYQLDGGIVSYMEKYPGEDFRGTLYVFDDRITMDFTPKEKKEIIGICPICKGCSERYINCANNMCHLHFILCEKCSLTKGAYCSEACKETHHEKTPV